jgi:cbb3-type cytochrome oxidase subunit 3
MTGNLEAVIGGVGIIVFTLVFIAGLMFMMGIRDEEQ